MVIEGAVDRSTCDQSCSVGVELTNDFAVSAYSHLIRSQAKCKEVLDQLCNLSEALRGSLSWTFKLVRGTVVVHCCRQLLRSQTALSR